MCLDFVVLICDVGLALVCFVCLSWLVDCCSGCVWLVWWGWLVLVGFWLFWGVVCMFYCGLRQLALVWLVYLRWLLGFVLGLLSWLLVDCYGLFTGGWCYFVLLVGLICGWWVLVLFLILVFSVGGLRYVDWLC